ncbi:MAG: TonB family protein [Pseudomonadota bacterium]
MEKHLSATRLPKWKNQSSVVRRIQATYPVDALGRGEQGIFRMRVIVSETGKVTGCVINNATVQDRLESPACKAMRKAEFEPALDADGKPFQSYYATSITYRVN